MDAKNSKSANYSRHHPATDESEYYKRAITIPVVDHLNSAVQARFDFNSVQVYNGLTIVPIKLISLANKGIDWKGKFKLFTDFYILTILKIL